MAWRKRVVGAAEVGRVAAVAVAAAAVADRRRLSDFIMDTVTLE